MKIKSKHFLSNQEFFDAAWNWLVVENNLPCVITENEKECGRCAYRLNNQTCVIGAFIPDDLYHPKFEGQTIDMLISNDRSYLDSNLKDWFKHVDPYLMSHVQSVHDNYIPDHTPEERKIDRIDMLKEIAKTKRFNLKVPEQI